MAGNERSSSKHGAGEESKNSSEQQTFMYRVSIEVNPAVILGKTKSTWDIKKEAIGCSEQVEIGTVR